MPILSLACLPRRYSVFIPAFSLVEFYSTKICMKRKDAVLKFWDKVKRLDLAQIKAKIGEIDICLSSEEIEIVKRNVDFNRDFQKDMDLFYDIPDFWRDWNFPNMAYQHEKVLGKYQILIYEEAKRFCGLRPGFSYYNQHPLYFKEYLK